MTRRVEAFAYGMQQRRFELDYTRSYVAQICGAHQSTLYSIECKGHNPQLWLAMAIAAVLGFPSADALADYGEELLRKNKKKELLTHEPIQRACPR